MNDLDRLPWFYKRYEGSLPRVSLPRDLPSTTAPAVAVLAGTADVAPDRPRPSAAVAGAPPVRRGRAHDGPAVRDLALPRRGVGGWPLPARGVRRRARGRRAARGRALVRPARPCPRSDRTAAARRGARAGRHRHPVAHGLALPRARISGTSTGTPARCSPSCSRAADSAGLTAMLHTRFPDAAVTALVGADGVHEWPVAVVALGDGTPALGASGVATMGDGRRGPRRVPARDRRATGGRSRLARTAVGSRRPGGRAGRGRRPDRDRRARARVAAPHGSRPRRCPRACCGRR